MLKSLKIFCLVSVFFISPQILFAGGATSKCVGQPTNLVWTSSGAASVNACSGGVTGGSLSCSFGANSNGSMSFNASASCTVNYNCYNSQSVWGTQDVATLNVNTSQYYNGSSCVAPVVNSVTVTGNYYQAAGNVRFTCTNADGYIIKKAGVTLLTGAYSGPSTYVANALAGGTASDYSVICRNIASGVESSPYLVSFNSTASRPTTPPAMSIVASPRTITKGQKTTVTWNATFPSSSCTLTASAVCVANTCSTLQQTASTSLNSIITAQSTDSNDPSTSRLISTAITLPAPGHKDTDVPATTIDYKGSGKKTFTIDTTTDFTYSCGTAPTDKKVTARVLVTKSTEQ